jgi:hypothetical protein
MAQDNHRRGQLRRKLRAIEKQQSKFEAQTERMIRKFTKKK